MQAEQMQYLSTSILLFEGSSRDVNSPTPLTHALPKPKMHSDERTPAGRELQEAIHV